MSTRPAATKAACALAVSLFACDAPVDEPEPGAITRTAEALQEAHERNEAEFRDLALDLEQWSARANKPVAAEQLLLPMMVRQGFLHGAAETDETDPFAAEYRRLEVRYADIERERRRIEGEWVRVLDRFRNWTTAADIPIRAHATTFPTPMVAPGLTDTLRLGGSSEVPPAWEKCRLFGSTISDDVVELCFLVEVRCTHADSDEPIDEIDEWSFWHTTCIEECVELPRVAEPVGD